jgi:hypothetical protein
MDFFIGRVRIPETTIERNMELANKKVHPVKNYINKV